MRKVLLVAVASVALAGCFKMSTTPPTNLPAYVHLYPGAKQVFNMNVGGQQQDMMTTTDTADQVMTYYHAQAAADGLTEMNTSAQVAASPGQRTALFGDQATGRMLIVIARPSDAEDKTHETMVDISYGKTPAKAPS